MPVVNQLYIYIIYIYTHTRKRSGPKIDPCGTPQVINPASEKTYSVTVKFFCLRDMIEAILNRLLKIIASIFCKSMV